MTVASSPSSAPRRARQSWRVALPAIIAAGALLLTGCSTQNADGNSGSQTLTLGTAADIESFDPAVLAASGDYVQIWGAVYDTLTSLAPDGTVEPNLATDWSYNEDNTILSLSLRDDVTFSDGTAFDADSVKTSVEHFIAGTGSARYTADNIERVDVVNDHEVEIHLVGPDPVLLTNLALPLGVVASPTALDGDGIALTPVGSGPYILDASGSQKGTEYRFDRNEDYWNTEAYPYDQVVVKVLPDVNARFNALVSGQIDAGRVNAALSGQVESQNLSTYNNPVDWVGLIILDRSGEQIPALAEPKVRQAMNMVFDRETMLSSLAQGMGSVTQQVVGQQSSAYDEKLNSTYAYDVAAAKDLMAEAGYANGFSIKMIDRDRYSQYLPYVEQALADIGITVTWDSLAEDVATTASFSGDYPVLIIANSAPVNSYDALNLAYGSSWNVFENESTEFSAFMEAARTQSDDASEQSYQDANAWLVENAWFVPWFYSDIVYASSPDVTVTVQAGNAGPQLRNYAPAE